MRIGRYGVIPLLLSLFCGLIILSVAAADEADPTAPGAGGSAGKRPGTAWLGSADLVVTGNPNGVDLSGGIAYRDSYRYDSRYDMVSAYWQAGAGIDILPSYAQPSVHVEWMPALFFTGRLQYDLYSYFGANGGLLSFASAQDPFGNAALRARRGTEETGTGSRVFIQPMLQLKAGDMLVRNQSDLARYRFPGRGPYFLVQEYDTLLPNNGDLFANRTQVLKEIEKTGSGSVLVGPYYEIVHAGTGSLTRKQVGLLLYAERRREAASAGERHFMVQVGCNLKDPNREGQLFILIGIGLSLAH